MDFDPTKPVQLRNETKARILATDLNHPQYPLVVAVDDNEGGEYVMLFTRQGRRYKSACGQDQMDLVNIHEVIEGWLNVYDKGNRSWEIYRTSEVLYAIKEDADKGSGPNRIACIFVSNKAAS